MHVLSINNLGAINQLNNGLEQEPESVIIEQPSWKGWIIVKLFFPQDPGPLLRIIQRKGPQTNVLHALTLKGVRIPSLQFVAPLTQLTHFEFKGYLSQRLSLKPLRNLKKLTHLTIESHPTRGQYPIADCSALSGLTALEDISIKGDRLAMNSLDWITPLKQLKRLSLDGENDVLSLPQLNQMTQLAKVALYHFRYIKTLKPLISIPNLRVLSLSPVTVPYAKELLTSLPKSLKQLSLDDLPSDNFEVALHIDKLKQKYPMLRISLPVEWTDTEEEGLSNSE